MSELEQEEKNTSAAGDLIVPIRIDRCGATSFQTQILDQISFLMFDLCKSGIIPAHILVYLVSNRVAS